MVPITMGRVPITPGRVPITMGRVPITMGGVSITMGEVPITMGGVPKIMGHPVYNKHFITESWHILHFSSRIKDHATNLYCFFGRRVVKVPTLHTGVSRNQNMRRIELYASIDSNAAAICWARERALLASQMACPECQGHMVEVAKECSDGTAWKCSRTIDGIRHYRTRSIRDGSIFSESSLCMKSILFILYEWSIKTSRDNAAFELNLNKKTIGEWYLSFGNIAEFVVDTRLSVKIGDSSSIVEIDECQIGRRKHHRGRVPKECWVIGGLVRGSKPQVCFIEIVKRRNESTLVEVIRRRIHSNARIISDCWSAYRNLNSLGFIHQSVNHSENFISPIDPSVHTQGIENLWRCLRSFLNSKGSYSRRHLTRYLKEFVFRKFYVDAFEAVISGIEARMGQR